MKKKICMYCDEILDVNAIECSKGHSRFILSPEKIVCRNDIEKNIETTLKNYDITQEEIEFLADEYFRLGLGDNNIPIIGEKKGDTESKYSKISSILLNILRAKRYEEQKKLVIEEQKKLKIEKQKQQEMREMLEIKKRFAEQESKIRIENSWRNFLRNQDINQTIAKFDQDQYIEQFLIDHLKNINLKISGQNYYDKPDKEFDKNESFWENILNSPSKTLNLVKLFNFQIIDWFPRSPGLYHTYDARSQREEAEQYIREKDGILFYEPRGKFHMINGGIGAIRFKPFKIENEECQLCTATSDGYCHSGIPLAIPTNLLESINYEFYYLYKIIGEVKFLPDFLQENHFYHMERIPQIYIFVNFIKRINRAFSTPRISPMIYFTTKNYEEYPDNNEKIDYVTYILCKSDKTKQIDNAADWLAWYVKEYGVEIVTNFDQQRPTFKNVRFSLQNIMNGFINQSDLDRFNIREANIICQTVQNIKTETMTMTEAQIKVTLGNGAVIHGNFVVANKIKDSFNKATVATISDDIKEVLKNITTAVGQMTQKLPKEQAEQVANDMLSLTNEVTSEKPRQKWWQLSLEGIKEAALTIGEIGKPVLDNLDKLLPLIS